MHDLTRMMSEEWKALSDAEKQPFKDAAAADALRAKAANEAAGITATKRSSGPRKRKAAPKDGVFVNDP